MIKGILITMLIVLSLFLTNDVKMELNLPSIVYLMKKKAPEKEMKKTAFFKKTKKSKNSKKQIKKLCSKAKSKILLLEKRGKRKNTSVIQRCKRAYSDLRYQACHMKKYKEKAVNAAKNCRK